MIVVVLIGLLAAIALPSFRKVRESAHTRLMINDARQIASAAQQYITDNNGSGFIAISVSANGEVNLPLGDYVKTITKGTQVGDYDSFALGTLPAFTMSNAQVSNGTPIAFDTEGKPIQN
jgi:type IV pilus assembly protein PilA